MLDIFRETTKAVRPVLKMYVVAARQAWGYDEVNLNCGCPSSRVVSSAMSPGGGDGFGARLMQQPATVAAAVSAMRVACSLPVTVKHRIGVDGLTHLTVPFSVGPATRSRYTEILPVK